MNITLNSKIKKLQIDPTSKESTYRLEKAKSFQYSVRKQHLEDETQICSKPHCC